MNGEHVALMLFYGVDTIEELVDAQEAHIKKLQDGADKTENPFKLLKAREG